jgi:transposase
MERLTFEQYMSLIEDLKGRVEERDREIEKEAESERYKERVEKLRAFRGIDYLTALALLCEIGDFKRFPTAEAFMSYLGLVPKEASSGKKRKQGGITKCGNGHIRRLLTESSWQYIRPVQVSRRLARRRVGLDAETVVYADKAMRRLHKKYTGMIYRGKTSQVAVTAVARELAGFIWGAMNTVA